MLDKVFFWRHKEEPLIKPPELGLGRERELGLGLDESELGPATGPTPPMQGPPPSLGPPETPAPPSLGPPETPAPAPSALAQAQAAMPQTSIEKDIQILSAKLDSLKAILENIHQRLVNIERIAHESEKYERY